MGVSFKISKTGSRVKPKPALISETIAETSGESSKILSKNESNNSTANTNTTIAGRKLNNKDEDAAGLSASTLSSGKHLFSSDDEVSFTLNLFPDGYSIGKPSEDNAHYASLQEDAAKLLQPYDRASETLFSAIESGWLPGDILDDIPCKYVDGGLICEVRDFRKCISDSGSFVLSAGVSPTTAKVHLKMSLENVVKDIPSIVDDSWTYGDLMEVESRIVKALQPKLCLDPTPRLDRLCSNPASSKLDLGLSSLRRKRLREMPEVTITYGGRLHGKKISVGRLPENSSYRVSGSGPSDVLPQHVQETISMQNIGPNIMPSRSGSFVQDASVSAMNVMPQQPKYLHGVGNQRSMQDPSAGTMLNTSGASVSQDTTMTYNDNMNSNTLPHTRMETQEGQISPYSTKRVKLGSVVPDSPHSQQIGSYMDSLQGADAQWKNPLLQQQGNSRGIQYSGTGMPKYSQLGRDTALNQDGATAVSLGQQGMRYGVTVDNNEADKLDKSEPIRNKNDGQITEADINQQRLAHQAFIRNNFPQAGWNSLGQQVEKDSRREEQLQKRKTVQSPRVSSGIVSHSPFSAKSAELAGGSLGGQYGGISHAAPLGSSQRDKSVGMSLPSAIRSHSGLSGANDSMQQQVQATAKWRSNSLPKAQAMSGVGSPASISTANMPMNAASPSVSSGTMGDQSMLEKFSKIEMVAARYKLNCKSTKVDDYIRKPRTFSTQEVMIGLSNASNNDNVKDDNDPMPLSKALVGGDINSSKIRVLTFSMPDTALSGNSPSSSRTRSRLIMSVKPQDATIAMHFGDMEDRDYLNAEDYLPSLATPHFADLLASQFITLMGRDGYYVDDHVQLRPARPNAPSTSQSSIPSSVNEMQQYADGASGPQTHETKPIITTSANQSPSLQATSGISSPGGNPMQMSQGLMHGGLAPSRPVQPDAQQAVAQQHAQLPNQQQMMHQNQPQFSRSALLPPTSLPQLNQMSHNSNMPLGGQMPNKPSLQMLQQPNQQQQQQPHLQQSQMQRKMMVGLGTAMGMGNINNNMVGLGGLGGVMGIQGPRGIGGVPGVSSSPMGSLSGIGNMAQNSMGINQATNLSNTISQLRAGALTPQAQAFLASRMRMAQSRGMLGGPQAGVAGISGGRQMQPGSPGLSMLSQGLNRGANINPMQRTAMGSMAAPKLMTGMNVHMNQQQLQQQQQLQMQQQQQQQQTQQLQQPQLQQQDSSPLQSVLSPQQVGSQPMGLSPTIDQSSMIQQQASPQISSGAMHPASSGNPEVGPASPQLSSQTIGSVGSLRNSPMDMQGVNKKGNA